MTRSIPAIYENGVFRPTEPVSDLPEHASVRLTVEPAAVQPVGKRIFGLQRDKLIEISPDFDEELGDAFWLGEDA
jgi:predicted DNA-binding antitoxin AbrB/MazE fold protein